MEKRKFFLKSFTAYFGFLLSFVYKNKIIIQIKPLGIAQQVVKATQKVKAYCRHPASSPYGPCTTCHS